MKTTPKKGRPKEADKPQSKYTAFRCPEDLLALAKVRAKKDRRSVSTYIILLIERDIMKPAQ